MAATTEDVPRPYGRGTSSVVSFVVAMNRVDVVALVVDLVDVAFDVALVDVDTISEFQTLFQHYFIIPNTISTLFQNFKHYFNTISAIGTSKDKRFLVK